MTLPPVSLLFLGYITLFVIGIGPALWFMRQQNSRVAFALCIAPVMGLAETGLIFYPLILHDLTISRTALPVILLLVAFSIGLAVLDFRQHGSDYHRIASRRTLFFVGIIFSGSILLLLLPPLLGGQNTQFWQYSAWDAISYMKMAVYAQHLPVSYSLAPEHFQDILQVNPVLSVIFSLKLMLARPAASNTLAWLTTLYSGIPLHEGYYFLKLLYIALVFGPVLAIGKKLKLPLRWCAACAVVLTLGFWTGLVINLDALSQMSVLSLNLLVLFALLCIEREKSGKAFSRVHVFLGFALAAAMAFYPESFYLTAGAIGLYYLLCLVRRQQSWRQQLVLVREGIFVGVAALLFQLPGLGVTLSFMFGQAELARTGFASPLWYFDWLIGGSPLRDIWGLHFFQTSAGFWAILLVVATLVLGFALTTMLVAGISFAFTRRAAAFENKILAIFVMVFWGAGFFLLRQQIWVAGKILSWGAPFVIIALFLYAQGTLRPLRIFRATILIWFVSQAINPVFNAITYIKPEQYPLYSGHITTLPVTEIDLATTSIVNNPPKLLGVDFSNLDPLLRSIWTLAAANSSKTAALSGGDGGYFVQSPVWWQESDEVPDQLLLSNNRDFLTGPGLGRMLVDNRPQFILSAVTPDELDQALMFPSLLDLDATAAILVTDADQPYLADDTEQPARWLLQRQGDVPAPEQTLLRFWASGTKSFAVYLRYMPNFSGSVGIEVNGAVVSEQTFNSAVDQETVFCVQKPGINTIKLNYAVNQVFGLGRADQRLLLRDALFAENGKLDIGTLSEQLLVGEGWYAPEQWGTENARWSGQDSQIVLLTCQPPSTLRFRAYAEQGVARIVTLTLNLNRLDTITLESGWHEYELPIPPEAYRPDEKQILALSHNGAETLLNDKRAVSAAYDWFGLE